MRCTENFNTLVNRKGTVLHVNTHPHIAQSALQKYNEFGFKVLPHPPDSQDCPLTNWQPLLTSISKTFCRENASMTSKGQKMLFRSLSNHVFCCCSVTKLCPTLCNPVACSTPDFPVLHYLLEFAQTQVHWVSDAIQPSHPLSHPFPPAPNLSQYQGLFQWVGCCIRWTKYGSFNLSISTSNEYSNPLGLTGLISLLSERFPRGFSSTTVKKHQFFSIQPSLWPSSHICTWLLEKP